MNTIEYRYLRINKVTPEKLMELNRDGWNMIEYTFPNYNPNIPIVHQMYKGVDGKINKVSCNVDVEYRFSRKMQV